MFSSAFRRKSKCIQMDDPSASPHDVEASSFLEPSHQAVEDATNSLFLDWDKVSLTMCPVGRGIEARISIYPSPAIGSLSSLL